MNKENAGTRCICLAHVEKSLKLFLGRRFYTNGDLLDSERDSVQFLLFPATGSRNRHVSEKTTSEEKHERSSGQRLVCCDRQCRHGRTSLNSGADSAFRVVRAELTGFLREGSATAVAGTLSGISCSLCALLRIYDTRVSPSYLRKQWHAVVIMISV